MATEEVDSGRGFTVVDKRGSAHAEAPRSESAGSETEPRAGEAGGPHEADSLPRVDFSTFVLSLGTSALYHMGFVRDPQGGDPEAGPDLPLARQTIDTLEMLEAKTRGNLEQEEAHLLENLLYELRMRYVEASK